MKIARKRGPTWLARQRARFASLALLPIWLTAHSGRAEAGETAPAVSYAIAAPEASRAEALEPFAREWLRAHHAAHAQAISPAPLPTLWPAVVTENELEVLNRVEGLLREARELSARFDEHLALQRFSEADRLLRSALEIPHVHAWLAEVSLELGLCAAQLGAPDLAETALVRAASLDPQRTLQAAEAPPSMVALARSVERRRATAPLSQVSIEVEPLGATLWLDGKRLGQAPQELSVSSGVHVLRVAAPGYHTYATLLELGPGRRSPVRVHLAETREEAARLALARALVEPKHAMAEAPAFAAVVARPLWLFVGDTGPLVRGLAYLCDPDCALQGTLGQGPALATRDQRSPAAARAWLQAAPVLAATPEAETAVAAGHWSNQAVPPAKTKWKRWPVWVGGAVALVGAGLAVGLLATREPRVVSERELRLDPGELPP